MKIVFINPNSSDAVTEAIRQAVKQYNYNGLEVDVVKCQNSPTAICNAADELLAGANVMKMAIEEELDKKYDAIILGCFADPGLSALRETVTVPVTGLLESSMIFAKLQGKRISIIASGNHEDLSPWDQSLRSIGEANSIASVRCLGSTVEKALEVSEEHILRLVNECIREDGAEVVVLGCASFAGKGESLSRMAGIPVIDGIKESLTMAVAMRKYKEKKG